MKVYIGNGKKHQSYDVIKCNICLDNVEQYIYTSEKTGKRYLSFDVSARQSVDQYGNSHAVSIWTPDKQQPIKTSTGTLYPDNPPDVSAFDDSDIQF